MRLAKCKSQSPGFRTFGQKFIQLVNSVSWELSELARLLKRVFDIDVEHCPNCGGALKIIAAIEDPPVIIKILSHLGLPTRAPPRSPARRVDLFQTI
jgi:hypothetical protein